jgi:hypothetical protein
MIKKGDRIDILPEWQDPGDDNFVWVAVDDEEKGRITISPISMDVPIKPCSTVFSNQLVLREAGFALNILKEQGMA